MAQNDPKLNSLCIIIWRDAITDDGWSEGEAISELVPLVKSVGWVRRRTKGALIIDSDRDLIDGRECNRRIEVPRGMIQAVFELDFALPKEFTPSPLKKGPSNGTHEPKKPLKRARSASGLRKRR